MARRLYFSTTTHSLSPITPSATWGRSIAAAFTKITSATKQNTALADTAALPGGTTTTGTRWMSFLSDPLRSAFSFTTSHTVSMVILTFEAGGGEDAHLAFTLRVMQGDTSTARGTLASIQAASTEFSSLGLRTRSHSAVAFSSNVSALAGDRLCMEVGMWGVTPANLANVTLRFGDPIGTADLVLGDGGTTDLDPWWEISADPEFTTDPIAKTGSALVRICAIVSPTPTARGSLAIVSPCMAVRGVAVSAPQAIATSGAVQVRAGGRLATETSKAATAQLDVRAASRLASLGQQASTASVAVRTALTSDLQAQKDSAGTLVIVATTQVTLDAIAQIPHGEAVALTLQSRLTAVGVRGAAADAALYVTVWSEPGGETAYVLSGWPPAMRLTPVNLGYAYRGDTLILPVWQAVDQRGNLIDLTGSEVWFTAKADLADSDLDPITIQCSTLAGGVVIIDPLLGSYQVTVPSDETQQLDDDTKFIFDVQIETSAANIHTVRRGVLAVIRDITRTPA